MMSVTVCQVMVACAVQICHGMSMRYRRIQICMHLQISMKYNNPDVILQVFPSQVTVGVLTPNETANYQKYMSELYRQTQRVGMTNVHLLQLNAIGMPLGDWCAVHPSAAADVKIAAQLNAFIQADIAIWPTSTYLPNSLPGMVPP